MELDKMTVEIEQQIDVKAPIAKVFEGIIRQITTGMVYPDGRSMNMHLERKPGGRWYRDLGDGNGHLWGFVQSIKAPTLLELCGPTMMSYPVVNHIDFVLKEEGDSTHVRFRHRALGFIQDDHRTGMAEGWRGMIEAIKTELES
ncbi:MAG: hypothetical protein AMXMBFR84_05470 [Candidatus Hydrogenedentota bacterium]